MLKVIKIFNYLLLLPPLYNLIERVKNDSLGHYLNQSMVAFRELLNSLTAFIIISILIIIFENFIKIKLKLKDFINIEITKDDE
jgi:hypothetical protein